jgi:hypothetical protein
VEEAKNLRFGGGGVPAPEKMRPLAGVRGMARAAPDRRRRSLGQGGAARYVGARWPPAGWMAVWPAVGRPEMEKKGCLLSPNLWLSRLSPRETHKVAN